MPYTQEIIKRINTELSDSLQLNDMKVKYLGLVEMVYREASDEINYPAVIDYKGNEVAVPDDNYDMIIYHRMTSQPTYEHQAGFGDTDDETETTTIIMVVWANAKRLKKDKTTLLEIVAAKLPTEITAFGDYIYNIRIEKKGLQTDSKVLFNQEYKGVEYRIDPEHLLAGVNYTIDNYYNRACLSLCEDCL